MKKLGIVVAYRKEETDLDATIADAQRSAGGKNSCVVFAVEDKDMSGPGWNRHRGIDAAIDCDVVAIIDAHMRFRGNALKVMAGAVREKGGMLCPRTWHNENCSFDTEKAPYKGARIVWQSDDHQPKFSPLAAKWARDGRPATCVMGACYVFKRDWYYSAGQPLSILRGWGGDEEALSIAAWMTGEEISVHKAEVAHRYRAKVPYAVAPGEQMCRTANRVALCRAFIVDASARTQQIHFAKMATPQNIDHCFRPEEIERLRLAMLKAPRSFEQWRREVCDPSILGGMQSKPAATIRRTNPVVVEHGISCPHCQTVMPSNSFDVTNSYPNGNRRRICPTCFLPFVTVPEAVLQ